MKHQYFGDLNDYRKYGLLRILSSYGEIKIAICWMLTLGDSTSCGSSIEYLGRAKWWRSYDSDLFDFLTVKVRINGKRDLRIIQDGMILGNTIFYNRIVSDDPDLRMKYFADFYKKARSSRFIFFDPDNGFEVKSKSYGRKGSCKYLYWMEVAEAFGKGNTILVYQHFPRENRKTFVERVANQLLMRTGAKTVYSFKTSTVAYFLVPEGEQNTYFYSKSLEVVRKWSGQITLEKFANR